MDGPDAIDGPDAKKYNSIHVYIVDDPDRNPTQQRGRALTHLVEKPDIHKWSCKVATDFFTKYGSAVIHPVCFPSGTTETAYFQFWTQELGKLTSDDLMIIYYHGEAGGQDEEWSWRFTGYPKREVNAYRLLRTINESTVDCLMLLDCFIQTRFTDKQKKLSRVNGHTEIIARGARMQDSHGKALASEGDFTEALFGNLTGYLVDLLEGERKKTVAPTFFLKIMARDKSMYSNPLRIWFSRPQAGRSQPVFRFLIYPDMTRKDGCMKIYRAQIQGEKEVEEDEGIQDMESEAGVVEKEAREGRGIFCSPPPEDVRAEGAHTALLE